MLRYFSIRNYIHLDEIHFKVFWYILESIIVNGILFAGVILMIYHYAPPEKFTKDPLLLGNDFAFLTGICVYFQITVLLLSFTTGRQSSGAYSWKTKALFMKGFHAQRRVLRFHDKLFRYGITNLSLTWFMYVGLILIRWELNELASISIIIGIVRFILVSDIYTQLLLQRYYMYYVNIRITWSIRSIIEEEDSLFRILLSKDWVMEPKRY